MMNKIVLILIFLVSFNSYSREYEYDKQVTPIWKSGDICYFTLKSKNKEPLMSNFLDDDETCEDFLAFNQMLKDTHPDKARLPFSGVVKGVNYDERIIVNTIYKDGDKKNVEHFKNGKLIHKFSRIKDDDVSNWKSNYFSKDGLIKLTYEYGKKFTTISLFNHTKLILQFYKNSNDTPLRIEKNVANKLYDLENSKFIINFNNVFKINSFAFYNEAYESFDITYFHDDKIRSEYWYEITKEMDQYKYKLKMIKFYFGKRQIVNISYDRKSYNTYKVTRYLGEYENEFRWENKSDSQKWECYSAINFERVHNSKCENFDQSAHDLMLSNYFNNYNYPLYPEKLFEQFGFK